MKGQLRYQRILGQGDHSPCRSTTHRSNPRLTVAKRMLRYTTVFVLLIGLLLPLTVRAADTWTASAGSLVYAVATTADGSMVITGRRDNLVVAYDAAGRELWTFPANGTIYDISTSKDGSHIVVASEDRHIYLLDQHGKSLWNYRGAQTFLSTAITNDGAIIAAGSEDKTVTVFDQSGQVLWNYTAGDHVTALALYGGAKGYRLLVGSRDSRVTLLNNAGQTLWRQTLSYGIRGIGVTSNGANIAVGDNRGALFLLDGASGTINWQISLNNPLPGVAISRDGSLIAAGSQTGELAIFDQTGKQLQRTTLSSGIDDLAFNADASLLVVARGEDVVVLPRTADGSFQIPKVKSQLWHYALPVLIALAIIAIVLVLLGLRTAANGERVWRSTMRHQRQRNREIKKSWLSYLFLFPTIILLLVFSYYPAFSGIVHSFTEWSPGTPTKWVGLDQFRYLANNRYFWAGITNLLIFIGTGFLKLLIPLIVAEMIFHLHNSKVQYAFRTMFVIQIIVPGVVGVLLWVNVYDPNIGLANQILRSVGLDGLARYWLGDAHTAIWAIVFMGFPWVSAFALLIFYGGLISIPGELFDAAALDGASTIRRIVNLDLPLLLGQIRLLVILTFIAMVQEFTAVFLTTGGGPGSATYVPSLELYYQAVRFNNFGAASAIGAVLFIIILGGTILNLHYVKSSVEYSA